MGKNLSEYLNTNISIILEKREEDMSYKLYSKIIGWKKGSFIIIKTPTYRDFRVSFTKGEEILARFFSEGRLISFKSHIILLIPSPIFVTLIAYPESFDEISLRKFERVPTYIPAKIVYGENTYNGTILDLSLGGALLSSEAKWKKGDKLKISFYLPSGSMLEDVGCEVRSVREECNGFRGYLYSLKFDEIPSEYKLELKRFFDMVAKSGRKGNIWVSQPS